MVSVLASFAVDRRLENRRVKPKNLYTLVSNNFPSIKNFLFSSATPRKCWWNIRQWTQRKFQPIGGVLTLLNLFFFFFTFSVKDKYQLNCTKDFNAQTITSLKLNLFYFFIYCCQPHERETTCLDIFLISDRQWDIEQQYLLSRFLGVSILQLLLSYSIYDYDMLTLSQ